MTSAVSQAGMQLLTNTTSIWLQGLIQVHVMKLHRGNARHLPLHSCTSGDLRWAEIDLRRRVILMEPSKL